MMNRQDAMYHALRFLKKSETLGSYFEFGLYQGQSIVTAYKIHTQIDDFPRHFYGFDSFSGLPPLSEDDNLNDYGVFYEGQFSVSKSQVSANLIKNGMPGNSFTLIEGFYNESLYEESTIEILGDTKAALVHIDCDLYSSAIPCLDFIAPRLVDGAILMFDDWFCYRGREDKGVRRAFNEWSNKVEYSFTEYSKYSWSGIMFICSKK